MWVFMKGLEFKPYKAIVPGEIYQGIHGNGEVPIVMLSRFRYPSLVEGVSYVQNLVRRFKATESMEPSEDLAINPTKAAEFFISRLPMEVREDVCSGNRAAISLLEEQFGKLGMAKPDKRTFLPVHYGVVSADAIKKNSGKPILHNRIFYENQMKEVRRGMDSYTFTIVLEDGLRLPSKGKVDLFFEKPQRQGGVIMVNQGDFYDFPAVRNMADLVYENMPNGSVESVKDLTELRLQTLASAGLQGFLSHISMQSTVSKLVESSGGFLNLLFGNSQGISIVPQPQEGKSDKHSNEGHGSGDAFAA